MTSPTPPQTAISLHALSHFYRPGLPVLQDVSLEASPGEIIGLIGRSGAGKSTLLRCVNGLVIPRQGQVQILGRSLDNATERDRRLVRRQIGMIFQEFNLVDRLTVLKNVLVGRLGYAPTLKSCFHLFDQSDIKLAGECIAAVGLGDYTYRRVRDLSGGQKQRVAIARTMAQKSRIVLGDEPTANLDAQTTDEVMELLTTNARASGVCLLLSLHDLALAKRYCGRIVALQGGKVLYDGTADGISHSEMREALN